MIQSIEIENFKSLRKVRLELGRFNLLIGTNASGKSNFLEALRVLQGIGYGFTIREILDGKPKGVSSEIWEGVRGGAAWVCTRGSQPPLTSIEVVFAPESASDQLIYSITFDPEARQVVREFLKAGAKSVFQSEDQDVPVAGVAHRVRYGTEDRGKGRRKIEEFDRNRPVLHQLLDKEFCSPAHRAILEQCIANLSNAQRVDPLPDVLRGYSSTQKVQRMGDRGENFAALVATLIEDARTQKAYTGWLEELVPSEVHEVLVVPGALREPMFAIRERAGDDPQPAPILSDGTLRFAAITAACFQPDSPALLTLEEIENGIHPTRLRLLVELLRSQARSPRQIIATTHSPIVLAWLQAGEYTHTFFCCRDSESGVSSITSLDQVHHFNDIVSRQPLGDLFAEGWLEGAL